MIAVSSIDQPNGPFSAFFVAQPNWDQHDFHRVQECGVSLAPVDQAFAGFLPSIYHQSLLAQVVSVVHVAPVMI